MYPVLFRIGGIEVTSFGVMVAVAAIVGLWLFRRELASSALPVQASDAALWGLVGGLLGAKLLWVRSISVNNRSRRCSSRAAD